MSDRPFADKARPPDEAGLEKVLGSAAKHWDSIVTALDARDELTCEWKFYGKTLGWQWKATRGKRAVVYLIPYAGHFVAALALNDGEVEVLRTSGLPAAFVRAVEGAKRAPEGRPARVEVRIKKDANLVTRLLAMRLSS